MFLLSCVIGLRSVAWFALLTFVPLWVVSHGDSEGEGNRLLSLMLLSGAVGTLLLGPIADRIGLRRTLLVAQAVLPPLILVFVLVGGVVGALALMLVGICVVGTFGVTMVLSQMYLPRHVGMASGLSVGLAMGLGGIAAVAPRWPRGRGRPADGALRRRRGAGARGRRLPLPPGADRRSPPVETAPAPAASSNLCPIERSVNEEIQMTVQEFFDALPERSIPPRRPG